jgi:hypothetical protein
MGAVGVPASVADAGQHKQRLRVLDREAVVFWQPESLLEQLLGGPATSRTWRAARTERPTSSKVLTARTMAATNGTERIPGGNGPW